MMFGLTIEKLFIVALAATFILGPRRLGTYSRGLGDFVRAVRAFVDNARTRAEADLGVPLRRDDWRSLDLRRYDPRRIVREALEETASTPTADSTSPPLEATAASGKESPDPRGIRPGQKYLVTGPASHPRRILIASLPSDDPRRIAANPVQQGGPEIVSPLPYDAPSSPSPEPVEAGVDVGGST